MANIYIVTLMFPIYGSRDEIVGQSSSSQYFAERSSVEKYLEEMEHDEVSAKVREVEVSQGILDQAHEWTAENYPDLVCEEEFNTKMLRVAYEINQFENFLS